MIDPNSINTISDLRFKTKEVFERADKSPVFLFQRSTPKGVLLSIKDYQILMEELEDYRLSLKAKKYEKENKKNVQWVNDAEIKNLVNV